MLDHLPVQVVYDARAIGSRHNVMKNRNGKQSKLQAAIGRLMPHLVDDEVVIVIRARDLHRQSTESSNIVPTPTYESIPMRVNAQAYVNAMRESTVEITDDDLPF